MLDLYAGVGLFAAFLADAVGPDGSVVAVEGDRAASRALAANLAGYPWARSVAGRVDRVLHPGSAAPTSSCSTRRGSGAKRQVVRAIAALAPRAVAYVACDPAALARDLGYFAEDGYELADAACLRPVPDDPPRRVRGAAEKTGSDLRKHNTVQAIFTH